MADKSYKVSQNVYCDAVIVLSFKSDLDSEGRCNWQIELDVSML